MPHYQQRGDGYDPRVQLKLDKFSDHPGAILELLIGNQPGVGVTATATSPLCFLRSFTEQCGRHFPILHRWIQQSGVLLPYPDVRFADTHPR